MCPVVLARPPRACGICGEPLPQTATLNRRFHEGACAREGYHRQWARGQDKCWPRARIDAVLAALAERSGVEVARAFGVTHITLGHYLTRWRRHGVAVPLVSWTLAPANVVWCGRSHRPLPRDRAVASVERLRRAVLRDPVIDQVAEYPYVRGEATPEHELVLAVHRAVPRGLSYRSDVCQEVLVRILEGTLTLEELPRALPALLRELWHRLAPPPELLLDTFTLDRFAAAG